MADQDGVVQIERLHERRQIVGVVVHVVTLPGLAGPPMAAPVMGNGAIAMGGHVEQLVVPGVGIEGPAVAEDDGLARAPVLVEDRRSILCGDGACTHAIISSFMFENVLLCFFPSPCITLCLLLSLLLSEPPVSALPSSQLG